jgi:hypothetical protein
LMMTFSQSTLILELFYFWRAINGIRRL